MDLREPLPALLLAGSLVACGDDTDPQRGETNCDSSADTATNPIDASCEETGQNDGNPASPGLPSAGEPGTVRP